MDILYLELKKICTEHKISLNEFLEKLKEKEDLQQWQANGELNGKSEQ